MTSLFHAVAANRVSSILFMIGVLACVLFFAPDAPAIAQRITATPISGSLPQQTQPAGAVEQEIVFFSPTPSITPTEDLAITLELNPALSAVNIYELPDFEDGVKIAPINADTRYPVTGRYFQWLQFTYDISSTGFGWVHESEVVLNNGGLLPEINPFETPTATAPGADVELTRAAVTLTPGAFETLDAEARMITVPGMEATGEAESAGVLPTFTKPAEVAPRDAPSSVQNTDSNTFEETLVRAASGQIPPLMPILMLAGAGLLGMIVSLWRR